MYHGNMAALVAGSIWPGRRTPVLWNIRHTPGDLKLEKWVTAQLIRIGAHLSSRTARILYNSSVSARYHEDMGYSPARSLVIPNGVPCDEFSPAAVERCMLRADLRLGSNRLLVGRIARYHAMKDFTTFLRAAKVVAQRGQDVQFVMVGAGVDDENSVLTQQIRDLGLSARVHMLGEQRDMPALIAGLDICCSSSAWGEGFPNVIAEAMACGVPCAVTDVGDSAHLVADTGKVVRAGDVEGLASALQELLDLQPSDRAVFGQAARRRIQQYFSLDRMAARYEELYVEILDNR
jgi:glycosyltransferase involved in cell wall biosynthesis